MKRATFLAGVLVQLFARLGGHVFGAETDSSRFYSQILGGDASQWTGLAGSEGAWQLRVPGEALWRHPDGPRGQYNLGFRVMHDNAADWSSMTMLQFDVRVEDDERVELAVTVTPESESGVDLSVRARAVIQGRGWHWVKLPWTAFEFPSVQREFLQKVKELKIAATGVGRGLLLRNVRTAKGSVLGVDAEICGKAGPAGGTIEYPFGVCNLSSEPQAVSLSFARYGWETMKATVEPAVLTLAPGEVRTATVRVEIPANVPSGGHEQQVLTAVPNGDANAAETVTFVTARSVPRPNILHTEDGWDQVREVVRKYDWAKKAEAKILSRADKFHVPEPGSIRVKPGDMEEVPAVFATSTEAEVLNCAIAWELSQDKGYALKVADFLRALSNPRKGYPTTFRACDAAFVQEGGFFQHIAMAYDMIHSAGVLSDADHAQIARTFRLYLETVDRGDHNGAINNWNVSELTGALFCALALQDLAAGQRFFSGPSGITDQLAKGVMDDGWWYECSINYNSWVASEFTQAALALEPWGINFRRAWVPASYSPSVMLTTDLSGGQAARTGPEQPANFPFGMSPYAAGPHRRPYRAITDMWDSLLPFLDYRGVMFGVNDSTEMRVAGIRPDIGISPFELAYFAYRDPAYAAVVRLAKERDLIYAVPDLPETTSRAFRGSAYADNVGVVTLRSQTDGRPAREQIQATLHYGTHGWAHGHYDVTSLVSLMRYGRSFYNPEMIWYGYGSFLYKFYVQGSNAANMVVVDRKQQEATPGERLGTFSGKLMQASVVQTIARWSNPPYGGMVYSAFAGKTLQDKIWDEGRSMGSPSGKAPEYGTLTDYTEPVLQRRLIVVTDDYVVLADYLKGGRPHAYESLFQMKGFSGLEAAEKRFFRHDAQWDTDPLKDAQFVTDADHYAVTAPAKSRFEMRFGPGADNAGTRTAENENGVLNLDVHSLWPTKAEVMIATAPEDHFVEKQLFYAVRGDGRVLADGKVGAWILGRGEIDVSLDGVSQLELETKVKLSKAPTIFWGDARIITEDGREVPLNELTPHFENVVLPDIPGRDYFGGPVKIVGVEPKTTLPGQPKNAGNAGIVRVDLAGRHAKRLKAIVGSDYPTGDEAQRRKTYAVKAAGAPTTDARFLTIIEPYEKSSVIESAAADGADGIRVRLKDGRMQELAIENLTGSGTDVVVTMRELKDGQLIRTETSRQKP